MASTVEICNLALGWLAGNLITSLTDESVEASLCSVNFPLARDAVLEDRAWSFAIARIGLAPIPEPENYNYVHGRQFKLPDGCIRVLSVDDSVDFGGESTFQWSLERGHIIAEATIVYIKYIFREEDPERFPPNFTQALAARLASDLAIPLTESHTMQKTMYELYKLKLRDAAATDGMQGRREKIKAHNLVNARAR